LAKTNNDSILIFDDIHWSREMEQAWETIRNHPSVRCTIDLFFIGIVFFRQEFHEKQHFVIRY
ncbi:MAG TPA: SAM-dependent methyltransferase, partial [Chitinophagaceae bacterium]|nr:SAM-dependent methyltransferase [Chitinophagaceae bacterium]